MPGTFVWHPGKGPRTVAKISAKDGEMVRIKQVRSGIGHEARMRRTLEMTVIEGIKTTIPLHLKILVDPEFVAGKLSTSFMDRFLARPNAAGGRLAEAV